MTPTPDPTAQRWRATWRITPREKEVIDLVVQGKYNYQIATAMGISEGSVKEYLHRVFGKLRITNRTELAMWALKQRGLT